MSVTPIDRQRHRDGAQDRRRIVWTADDRTRCGRDIAVLEHLKRGARNIEGQVQNWHERELAETAAWWAPGVVDVEDKLTVAW